MKKATKGNMYEHTLERTWDSFAAHLSGTRSALVCVISGQELADPARTALGNSAEVLGYGPAACTFAAIESEGEDLDAPSSFLLVEGLDPRCVIAADEQAARTLGEAYRCDVPLDAPSRVFGRNTVAFRSFSAMLTDDRRKQAAWALLKTLPRFGER